MLKSSLCFPDWEIGMRVSNPRYIVSWHINAEMFFTRNPAGQSFPDLATWCRRWMGTKGFMCESVISCEWVARRGADVENTKYHCGGKAHLCCVSLCWAHLQTKYFRIHWVNNILLSWYWMRSLQLSGNRVKTSDFILFIQLDRIAPSIWWHWKKNFLLGNISLKVAEFFCCI